ncbi:M20/M25/M40 family metallo-hydrolase [Olivibacter domesticus]|uniref:Carboxypeptidase Q n=1 Tax=Olivibacter domesticus TaxID=407022 RepID=A0A1H7ZDL1_OLID1|nr:M20/M25/M40 family metallo-hydrolase [Olivibacter domesticus]SEM55577.1 Peptidase family M28 [Olivibacter domesticus]
MKHMKYWICVAAVFLLFKNLSAQTTPEDKKATIAHFFDESLTNAPIPAHLHHLTKQIGHRISGSPQAEAAVHWIKLQLEALKPDTVYLQAVKIPVWKRGPKEKAFFQTADHMQPMQVLAFGGSVATKGTLSAEVVEVKSWAELSALPADKVKGKFVFYNRAMDATKIDPFDAYLEAVDQRSIGAIEAAKKGAIGALVRSLTLAKDDAPHTGAMQYADGINKIPAAALGTRSADLLSQTLKDDPTLRFSLEMHCSTLPEIVSNNVIAEITGKEFPDEFITIGAHIDSWDVGEGASDDATGIAQTIEALRLFKTLASKPKRSIRFIFYMNEESGAHGGSKYASAVRENKEKHLASIESDAGGFQPVGFRIDGDPQAVNQIKAYSPLLSQYGMGRILAQHRGVDIAAMKDLSKVLLSLDCASHRLFHIHHSELDTLDKLNYREVTLGAVAMTAMAFLISEYGL